MKDLVPKIHKERNPADELVLNEILSFLQAHPFPTVQAALKQWRVQGAADRYALGWRPWTGAREEIPGGMDWRQIGTKLQVRTPIFRDLELKQQQERMAAIAAGKLAAQSAPQPQVQAKADLSAKSISEAGIKCPQCGGDLYMEKICPGCAEGRKGLARRLLCGECDWTTAL
jgi:hypothetical protein